MRKWLPLVATCLGTFVLLLDVTIVNVALPAVAVSLDASFSSLQWVVDGYALSLAALLLLAGGLADRLGRRRVYVVGLVLFAVASLVCGLAPSAGALVTARVVQGIGGAAMLASTAALIGTSYQGRDRGTAFGVWGAVSGAAAAAGPVVGGVLVQTLSWRWVFLVNLPIVAIAVGLTLRAVPESRSPGGRLDVAGAATFTLAAAGAVYGLVEGGARGWTDTRALVAGAVALLATLAFVAVERRAADPLLDLRLFGSSRFSALMVVAVAMQAAAFGALAYVSIWLQSILDLPAIRAGLVLLPLSLMAFVVSAAVGRHVHGRSPRLPIGGGLLLIGAGNLLLALVSPSSGWVALVPGLLVLGTGVGLATPVVVSATLAAVPGHRAGMAGGAVNTARQLGMALGIAVLGTLFAHRTTDVVTGAGAPSGLGAALSSGMAREALADAPAAAVDLAHRAVADALDVVFTTGAAVAVVAGLLALALVRAPRTDQMPEPVPA